MSNPHLPQNLPADFEAAFGYLSARSELSVDDMKLMVLLETAGEPLYECLATMAPDQESAELMRKNGREETAHAHRLKQAIELLTGEAYEIPELTENPYAKPPELPPMSAELLAGIVEAEKGGDAMYQGYAANAGNADVAALLLQNGREETRHGERLTRVIEILNQN
jgi:rubrerythrin